MPTAADLEAVLGEMEARLEVVDEWEEETPMAVLDAIDDLPRALAAVREAVGRWNAVIAVGAVTGERGQVAVANEALRGILAALKGEAGGER